MIKKYLAILAGYTLVSTSALAQAASQDANGSNQNINQRTAALERQVAQLEAQVAALKSQQRVSRPVAKKVATSKASQQIIPKKTQNINNVSSFPVTIAPYLGLDSVAVVTLPSYNEDVRLLQQRQRLEKIAQAEDVPSRAVVDNPMLEVSGKLEGQAYLRRQSNVNDSNIELTSAELDLAAHVNQWLTGLMTFGYDKNAGYPVNSSSSKVYIDQGFVSLGNFNQSPFYATLGQKYLPFGQYNNFMISAPLTQSLGRARAPTLSVGYQHPGSEGLYGSAYAFRGYTKTTAANRNIDRAGAAIGFENKKTRGGFDIGLDVISNIAESQGMQDTGGSGFGGFGIGSNNEVLYKRVPGVDLHGKFDFKPFTVLAEYNAAATKFNPLSLSFNGRGAQPQALDVQAAYGFDAWNKPSSFALGFDRTWQALALNLPQQRYTAAFNTAIWKNTIASLELLHAINYPSSNTGAGQQVIVYAPSNHNVNQLTARFGIYF